MLCLIIGGVNSGKSKAAENLTESFLKKDERAAYIATMKTEDEDSIRRIQKHRKMREGKAFVTLECPEGIDLLNKKIKDLGINTALLECLSNLCGNEMHSIINEGKSLEELTQIIIKEVLALKQSLTNLILVGNHFETLSSFDEETKFYIDLCDRVNDGLKPYCEKILEI